MQQAEKNKILVESLIAMRNSLLSTYEMKTHVTEESLLLKAFRRPNSEYVVFSDYRRNDGKRRIQDAMEVIDSAVGEIEKTDSRQASRVYLQTLKAVARISKMASVLEFSIRRDDKFEKEKKEGMVALELA